MKRIDQHRFGPWAIVTGASSGIGKEFARQLAANGINLVLVARRLPLLEALGHSLAQAYDIEYRAVGLDLANPGFMTQLEPITRDLDIGLVVSNAGGGKPSAFLNAAAELLHQSVQLNALAHLDIVHHFGKSLAARGRGGIVLVSAMGASQGVPYMANESATKAYVLTLGETLNYEFRKHGVNVTVLLPSPTETPIIEKFGLDVKDMPMKPMSVEQCVSEGLAALTANRPSHLTGRLYRIMNQLLPRSVFRAMNARMLEKAANR